MTYRIIVSHQAEKYLRKQSPPMIQRISTAIRGLPMSGDIKRLKGTDDYRLRVGDVRIIFSIDHKEKIIYIKTIDTRGDIYKK